MSSEFKIDYKDYNIVISGIKKIPINIPINSLLLNDGTNPTNNPAGRNNFETNQQQINYLDTIKDKTNVWMLDALDIYPKATGLPYNNLKKFEKNILDVRKNYHQHTTWLKVDKGSLLDKAKYYNECLRESGLGHETFLDTTIDVTTVKTFGSFIDPLEKKNAKKVWPMNGSSIKLTEKFMELMGFDKSSVYAMTKPNDMFEYRMDIKCGTACRTANCYLTHTGDDEKKRSDFYFQGNNEKTQLLNKKSATTKSKVKFIVTKEWGDKLQVIIYLMYYHYLNTTEQTKNVTMTTCDMVVLMLCMIFGIPCIYTGQYNPTGLKLETNEKYYSILEYKPSDNPYKDALDRLIRKRDAIVDENNRFITVLEKLVQNPDTPIRCGDSNFKFSNIFYQAIITDIGQIQKKFKDESEKILEKYKKLNKQTITKESQQKNINDIETHLKMFQSNFIIIPFLKIKKGTKNTLTILMTKSYTAQKPANNEKPSFVKYFVNDKKYDNNKSIKESKQSFLDLAMKYFQDGPNNNRYSGGGLSHTEIETLFPADEEYDEHSSLYDYTTNFKKENDTDNDIYSNNEEDSDIVNPTISLEPIKFNLLNELNKSFTEAFNEFTKNIKPIVSNDTLLYVINNFKDTIYTLFVYESYMEGCTKISFTYDDIIRIIKDYELDYDLDFKNQLKSSNKRKSVEPSSLSSDKPHKLQTIFFPITSKTKRKLIERFSKSKKNRFSKSNTRKNKIDIITRTKELQSKRADIFSQKRAQMVAPPTLW